VPSTYKILNDKDYADSFKEADAFALDVLVGLSTPRKKIPSKYFYDEKASNHTEVHLVDSSIRKNHETVLLTPRRDFSSVFRTDSGL